MSAASLETALRELGIDCTVEAMDRLAVVIPTDARAALDVVHIRREALRLMGAHGFANLALELRDEPAGHAAVHRD